MLAIKGLRVCVEDNEILRGVDLEIQAGQVHAIMGPNGSGKSTLAHVLAGKDGYQVTGGTVTFGGKDLLAMTPEVRAGEGIFLGFQYPVAIPGLNTSYFMRAALNAVRKYRGEEDLDAVDFLALSQETMRQLGIGKEFLQRAVNDGFSGGEKKRNEIFQLALLNPIFAILDEIDSGLDVDALKLIAAGVNRLRSPKRAMLLVTHYQRLLDHVKPDFVHVLSQGRIVRSGGSELAAELDKSGYSWLEHEPARVRG